MAHGFLGRKVGIITVSAELESVEDQRLLRFIYRDDGNGMTATQTEQIHEPFYTTARFRGATGLGMHIVFNLVVHKLGGKIDCKSELGQGVEFVIEVPCPQDDGSIPVE
ncbi:MAG: HAMP domain-containing histidine kinase [Psychrosphaera sp.]|nr:HAMP domain-containing histidine kinase [Psychrosphaera sp.]